MNGRRTTTGRGGAELRVRRGRAGDPERYDTYRIPYEEGMSVLDALLWVRIHVDPSLVFRYGCVNANACKTCMAVVDGRVAYLCTARLAPEGGLVEPLPARPLIRDLVTDTAPDDEKIQDTAGRTGSPPEGGVSDPGRARRASGRRRRTRAAAE